MLDSENLKLMYTAFIRPIMEYGSILYCSAARTHLEKLDRVQESAMKIGGFEVESLATRRDAAIASFALKLLDGHPKPMLARFAPKLQTVTTSRGRVGGLQIKPRTHAKSRKLFDRSFAGRLPGIWEKIPQEIILGGAKSGWSKIRKQVKRQFIPRKAKSS